MCPPKVHTGSVYIYLDLDLFCFIDVSVNEPEIAIVIEPNPELLTPPAQIVPAQIVPAQQEIELIQTVTGEYLHLLFLFILWLFRAFLEPVSKSRLIRKQFSNDVFDVKCEHRSIPTLRVI